MKKPSRHSDDSGPSNYQKLPSIAEIIQADQYRASHSLGTPPASPSPGPSFIKEEEDPPPQPIRPLSNLPHRFRDSSTEISLPRAGSLDFNQPAQARHQHALDRYPDNQTYKEALGQIMSLSHTIYNFAQANQSTALQQNTIPVNPVRLPREQEVSDMFRYLERTKQLLQQVGPPQTSLGLQLPNPMTTPMNASAGGSRPDLPVVLSTRCCKCSRFIARASRQRSHRGQVLCRDCNSYQTRQDAKRSSRRDRPL